MLKHKVRHQEAEKIIQQSQEYCREKERQKQLLLSQGMVQPPPETTLLGCWQIIEKTIVYNETNGRVPNFKIDDEKLFILSIDPEKRFFGELTIDNRTILEGDAAGHKIRQTLRCKIEGRIITEGIVKYRHDPYNDSRAFFVNGALMRLLPGLADASYNNEKMQGKIYSTSNSDSVNIEFEAVPIPNQIWL